MYHRRCISALVKDGFFMTIRQRISPFIGDKAFYRSLMGIAVPIMLQNGLTNLVSLLDNIMVGAVGTEQMSGVSIVNQLLFIFNLCVFGGLAGAGIFTAQFFGKKDHKGVADTFRFKIWLSGLLLLLGVAILCIFQKPLIGMYLHEGGETGDIQATAEFGQKYLHIMLLGLLPFVIQQSYASTLREIGETLLPMKAGIVAIVVNLVFNYILIFGHLGAPAMGVEGAAVATVLSRYVECAIIVGWTHRHTDRACFAAGIYRSLRVPAALTRQIIAKGMPLLVNEFLWSTGIAMLNQSYSTRGLAVVAAQNITSTVSNLFNVVWMAMGVSLSIVVGQQLGANQFDKARQSVRRIMDFSMTLAAGMGVLMAAFSGLFPMLYNTSREVRALATGMLIITAIGAPIHAGIHSSYFTLRSGGKTWITFLFDSVYLWVLSVPLAKILTGVTDWHILLIFAICQYVDIIKCIAGMILVKKGVWIHNIVGDKA